MSGKNVYNSYPSDEAEQYYGPNIDPLKLSFIGSIFTTLGDLISTFATALELQEQQQKGNEKNNQSNTKNLEKQMAKMQKQLDYIMYQLPKK